jgi:ribosomal protein S18 acetylase RimI-like enzyme
MPPHSLSLSASSKNNGYSRMIEIRFSTGQLDEDQQQLVSAGFENHTKESSSPSFQKDRINWLVFEDSDKLVGVLTADILWVWIYIDEIWVDKNYRDRGIGKQLMDRAEEYAISQGMTGLWLWTQGWQAPKFYDQLGYKEFTRFGDFPKGHCRIGYRKQVSATKK